MSDLLLTRLFADILHSLTIEKPKDVTRMLGGPEMQNMRCSNCTLYLTIFPIYTGHLGITNICGRCIGLVCLDSTFQRNHIYENLLKNFSFPCGQSEICQRMVHWNEAIQHEQKCILRTVPCPSANCNSSFQIFMIETHFTEQHPDHCVYTFDTTIPLDKSNVILLGGTLSMASFCVIYKKLLDCSYICISNLAQAIRQESFKITLDSSRCLIEFTLKCDENELGALNLTECAKIVIRKAILDGNIFEKAHIELKQQETPKIEKNTLLEDPQIKLMVCPFCADVSFSCSYEHWMNWLESLSIQSSPNSISVQNICVYLKQCIRAKAELSVLDLNFQLANTGPPSAINKAQVKTCKFCSKYLAVSPIFSSLDQKVHRCGRCSEILTTKNIMMNRNMKYEVESANKMFPCSVSAECKSIILFSNVKEHERNHCAYRYISCPHPDCLEIMPLYNVALHFQQLHLDSYMVFSNYDLKFDLQKCEQTTVLAVEDSMFLASCSISNTGVFAFIALLPPYKILTTPIKYRVTFILKPNTKVAIKDEFNLMPYCETSKYNLIMLHSKLLRDISQTKELHITHVQFDLVRYHFQLLALIKNQLVCPVCSNLMSSGIKVNCCGHSVCNACDVKKCPMCAQPFQGYPNEALQYICKRFEDLY